MPWVESSPFRNWVEWTWVDLEKSQVQGRQHIDFDPSPFDPIRPQSIRPKLFDQKGRPNSFRPISFDPFHAIRVAGQISTCVSSRDTSLVVGSSTLEVRLGGLHVSGDRTRDSTTTFASSHENSWKGKDVIYTLI